MEVSIDVPYEYRCPISDEIMHEPMKTNCAHVFERAFIALWLQKSNLCPLCREVIMGLTADDELKNKIATFSKQFFDGQKFANSSERAVVSLPMAQPQDAPKAVDVAREAGNHPLVIAQPLTSGDYSPAYYRYYGNRYFYGVGVKKDVCQAQRYYIRSAEMDDSEALRMLAIFSLMGEKLSPAFFRDYFLAEQYLSRACKLGNYKAIKLYANIAESLSHSGIRTFGWKALD